MSNVPSFLGATHSTSFCLVCLKTLRGYQAWHILATVGSENRQQFGLTVTITIHLSSAKIQHLKNPSSHFLPEEGKIFATCSMSRLSKEYQENQLLFSLSQITDKTCNTSCSSHRLVRIETEIRAGSPHKLFTGSIQNVGKKPQFPSSTHGRKQVHFLSKITIFKGATQSTGFCIAHIGVLMAPGILWPPRTSEN